MIYEKLKSYRNKLILPAILKSIFEVMNHSIKKFFRDDGTYLAAGMSYYIFFSVFPFLLGTLAIMGIFFGTEDATIQVKDVLERQLPGIANSPIIYDNLQSIALSGLVGIVSIIGLLWAGSAVFGALTRMMNRIWNLEDNRKFFKKKIMDVLYIIILGSVFFLTISIEILYGTVGSYVGIEGAGDSDGTSNFLETGWTWTTINILPPLLSFGLFAFIYTIIPQRKIKLRDSLVGATLGMLVFEYSKSLFVLYIYNFGNFDKVYGSISAVIILLLFSYVTSIIIVFFAEISYVYTTMREKGTFKFTSK